MRKAQHNRPAEIVTIAGYHRKNSLLAELSAPALAALQLECRDFTHGTVLWSPQQPTGGIYFPLSGVIAVTLRSDKLDVEVAAIGRDDMTAEPVAGALSQARTRGAVLTDGRFSYVTAAQFATAASHSHELRRMAILAAGRLLEQAQRLAACNAHHLTVARMSRWLLTAADGGTVVTATQDTIAAHLGLRRCSILQAAQRLRDKGIISPGRGRITIRDRAALTAAACNCHAAATETIGSDA